MSTKGSQPIRELLDEELINIKMIPDILGLRNGKKIHLSSVYRWVRTGLSGVKLQSVIIANERFTTKQALNRFWVKVTEAREHISVTNKMHETVPNAMQSSKQKHF